MPKSDRVWNLRLNLDEFNSMMASVFTDADRAFLLQGFSLGCNGGALPDGVPHAFSNGWEFGHAARAEAEAYKARQSEKGQASASARKSRSGTAQPMSNQARTSVRTGTRTGLELEMVQNEPVSGRSQQNIEPGSNQCSNRNPNLTRTNPQSSILNPITTNENLIAPKAYSELPRAYEEPPAPPPEPHAAPAEPETEPEGFSPEFQALAARLRSSQEVRAFGFGGTPPTIQPPPPVEAPAAAAPVSAEERARLESLPGDKRPSREDFARFAFAIAPKWREARSVFDMWVIRNWTIPPPIGSKQHAPQKIRNWRGALKNEIAGDGDPRHWMEMLPMGHLLKGDEK